MPETEVEAQSLLLKSRCVLVCQHQSCLRHGAAAVLAAFQDLEVPEVEVQGSECQGQCSTGPTVRILPEEVWYYRVQPSDVPLIVAEHLQQGKPVESRLNPRIHIRF